MEFIEIEAKCQYLSVESEKFIALLFVSVRIGNFW